MNTSEGLTSWCDPKTGLEWSVDANCFEKRMTWEDAIEACKSLDNGWRLPTVRELASLIDYTRYDPALPEGHPFNNVRSFWYWTATTDVSYPGFAWYVSMFYGYVNCNRKTFKCYVWPVRDAREDEHERPDH